MPVTELALLRLLPPTTPSTPSLVHTLQTAKNAMEAFNQHKHAFHYYTQSKDPSRVYILGTWDSVEQHVDEFIPGKENREMLAKLEGVVGVEWLLHVGCVVRREVSEMAVLGVFRRTVGHGDGAMGEEVERLEEMGLVVGRRLDGEVEGKEELVAFGGWRDDEGYKAFLQSEGFRKWVETGGEEAGIDVKRATPWNL